MNESIQYRIFLLLIVWLRKKSHRERKSLEGECPDWVGVAICNRESETSCVVFRVPEHMVDF